MAANDVSISMKSERSINSKIIRRISAGKTVSPYVVVALSLSLALDSYDFSQKSKITVFR